MTLALTCDRMAQIHAASFSTPRPWTAAEIAGLLASPLCFAEAEADGFAMARVVAGEAELLTIAVEPSARGRGAGGRLLAAIVARARACGAERMFLEVSEANPAALALYTRAGFVPTGRRRNYYHSPEGKSFDALVLARAI